MRKLALAFALVLLAASALAQHPHIVRGTVTSVAATADLGAQIRSARTKYIGYAVPEVEGERLMCCFENFGEVRSGGKCNLDHDGSSFMNQDNEHEQLHPVSGSFVILYRIENGEIAKVRTY